MVVEQGAKKKVAGTRDPPKGELLSLLRFPPKTLGNFAKFSPKNAEMTFWPIFWLILGFFSRPSAFFSRPGCENLFPYQKTTFLFDPRGGPQPGWELMTGRKGCWLAGPPPGQSQPSPRGRCRLKKSLAPNLGAPAAPLHPGRDVGHQEQEGLGQPGGNQHPSLPPLDGRESDEEAL